MAEQKVETEKTETAAPVAAVAAPGADGVVKKVKKGKRTVSTGHVYILSSFNNTIVTITDTMGNAICWSSAGEKGFVVLAKIPLLPLRLLPKTRAERLSKMVCAPFKFS